MPGSTTLNKFFYEAYSSKEDAQRKEKYFKNI